LPLNLAARHDRTRSLAIAASVASRPTEPLGASVAEEDESDRERWHALQDFVPGRYVPALSRAAQRWSVPGALLAAQLYAESRFNPFARSSAGAQGIAQRAMDAQAHLMRDLLHAFGSVPRALAAFNAGSARVRDCCCIPAIPETQAYVANSLGLLNGAGHLLGVGRLRSGRQP
jgi:soluble lytic murein transglycosylase-like protein